MPTVVDKPLNLYEVLSKQRMRDLEEQEYKEQERYKKACKSPYNKFYQVNIDNSLALRDCLDGNPKALKLLLFIFDHMDNYNALICSYKVFQEALKMSKATIQRAIRYLKDSGFLYVYKSGTSNVYVANKNLVWKSWGTNFEYCKFPANIILAESEQEDSRLDTKHSVVLQTETTQCE